ncbi:MAG: bifunctional riboflavin kinase/FAD synthetase [Anaerolineaceae bacterium]
MTAILTDWPENLPERMWLTIGNFDGMHLGHQALIARVQETARANGARSGLITFWPHPRVYLQKITAQYYLTTADEKMILLADSGMDYVISLPFTHRLANQSAGEFFADMTSHLNLAGLIVGQNFTLGKNRTGTKNMIRDLCNQYGIQLDLIESFCLNGSPVSSGRVRGALELGDVQTARQLLGRPYSVSGKVVEGKHLGSKLGFPTANQVVDTQKILPKYGVYASLVRVNGDKFMGVTSVGVRPTFEITNQPNVETLLLDFEGNIYHESLTVDFIQYIRDEIKFANVADLIAQIDLDKLQARRMLADESFSKSLPA